MSKIKRYNTSDWWGLYIKKDGKGELVFYSDIVTAYHPLLRDLRVFINDCEDMPRDSFNDKMIERINELLEEKNCEQSK